MTTRQLLSQPRLRMHLGVALRPDPIKAQGKFPLGEDAYFLSNRSHAMGVADGVGEWATKNPPVDCGLYSRTLMEVAKKYLDDNPNENDPKKAMLAAETVANKLDGSSTFSIMVLQDNKLTAAQIGDSGFLILRRRKLSPSLIIDSSSTRFCTSSQVLRGSNNNNTCIACEKPSPDEGWRVVFKSQEQQYRFNFPFQIGRETRVSADQATSVTIPLRAGDVIAVGTDGMFDNLFMNDILQIVTRVFEENSPPPKICNAGNYAKEMPYKIANALMEGAVAASMNQNRRGPFAASSAKAGYKYMGGKPDDIAITTAFVTCDLDNGSDNNESLR
jgi:protein phosphatase PTC7